MQLSLTMKPCFATLGYKKSEVTPMKEMHKEEKLESLIRQHMPFIIRTVSSVTGRYVSVEDDDAFSIALSAFAEAVERFDGERGNFLSYAALVIRSRLNTYLEKERRYQEQVVSLETMEESGGAIADRREENVELQEEIRLYQEELAKFGLTLEDMAEQSPKHRDTRIRGVRAAQQASENPQIVEETYRKRKLPIRMVAECCGFSEKIVKTSKVFILGTMLVFVKQLTGLIGWLRDVR